MEFHQILNFLLNQLPIPHQCIDINLIFNGKNVKVVSERLGHKSITETLDTCAHVMDDMKNNTADLLDNIFAR